MSETVEIPQTNIFQIIIASDGEESYTVFLYPESGLEWVRGTGKNRGGVMV